MARGTSVHCINVPASIILKLRNTRNTRKRLIHEPFVLDLSVVPEIHQQSELLAGRFQVADHLHAMQSASSVTALSSCLKPICPVPLFAPFACFVVSSLPANKRVWNGLRLLPPQSPFGCSVVSDLLDFKCTIEITTERKSQSPFGCLVVLDRPAGESRGC